jgi:GT2 family glycosyltransferase
MSVIIVSWNTRELLRRCLQALEPEIRALDAEVFLVDNNSADSSPDMVAAEFPWVNLIRNADNRGFACANNQAMRQCNGRKVLLLNPDTEVRPGAISTLVKFLDEHPQAGIVAPQLLNTDGTTQQSCRQFPSVENLFYELAGLSRLFPEQARFRQYKMLDFDHNHECQVDQPEGACLMVRREVIDNIGMLDEGYFMLFEEVDWCFSIKQAGWDIWFTPSAKVVHHYGQSIKQVKAKMIVSSHKGFHRFWRKHLAGNFAWMSPFVWSGLMLTAMIRILAYQARALTTGANRGILVELAAVVVLTALASIALFAWEGRCGLNLMDEGFLWYGAQRLLHGEMPVRDFMSYDVGRYYWAAGFMGLFNNHGVVALRAATALFGFIGMAVAAWLLRRTSLLRSWPMTIAVICVLFMWLVPRHKLYDITISVMIVTALANLLRKPNSFNFFLAGLIAGAAALIGRNHGFYAVLASMLSFGVMLAGNYGVVWRRALSSYVSGVLAGYLPNLLLMACAPGFAAAFVHSVQFTMAAGPSLSCPVPWPWMVLSYPTFDWQQFAVGCSYVLLIAFDVLGVAALVWAAVTKRPLNPLLVACIVVSICYSHHALYFAGPSHLSQAVFPMLMGVLISIASIPVWPALRIGLLGLLGALSFTAMLPMHPGYAAHRDKWKPLIVGSDRLLLDSPTTAQLAGINAVIDKWAPNGKYVVLPFWPTFYAMREQRSPLYEIYAFFPSLPEFQQQQIERLRNFDAGVVLLWNKPPEGQTAWRYERTNPLVYKYLGDEWRQIPCDIDPPFLTVYVNPAR